VQLLFAESSTRGWGTEQHFAALAIAMAQRGHAVRCSMSSGSPLEAVLREAGIPIVLSRRVRGSLDLKQIVRLHGLASRHKADWLITNNPRLYWPLILAGKATGTRTALFRHWEYMSRSLPSRKLMPRLADRFILVSNFQREHLRREGVNVRRMPILYNPIDTTRLAPSPEARARVRASLGITDSEVLVGYVGRMVRDKGIFTLLKASEALLAAAPQARLLWVGDGVDLQELRVRADSPAQGQRHIFRGWMGDIQGVYNALDVVVVPSEYPEPFGRVSVEAQACGTAVVCSDAGGLPETLAPGTSGVLARKGDPAYLAATILELVRDPARRRRMGLAGRQFACSNFSFDRIARDFEELLEGRGDIRRRAPAAETHS
jgi:glycosyltransferase involved in cell wall biosynthesis